MRSLLQGIRCASKVTSTSTCHTTPIIPDPFLPRHCYPADDPAVSSMLSLLGHDSLDAFISETIPPQIRYDSDPTQDSTLLSDLPPLGESATLSLFISSISSQNHETLNFMGEGFYSTLLPKMIQRSVLENPAWYTSYTPYQAEISQGRLEMLLNYQSMISSLAGCPVSNASLLDEASAVGEAVYMAYNVCRKKKSRVLVSEDLNRAILAVVKTRCDPLGVVCEVVPGGAEGMIHRLEMESRDEESTDCFGCVVGYPDTNGVVMKSGQMEHIVELTHALDSRVICCSDLLALTLLKPPGDLGVDIVVGHNQRFGIPMGFGGPHAGFLVCRDEIKRQMPGRVIGLTIDSNEDTALRMALQTREQHIRRERATSNICTSTCLIANISTMYALYHGPDGLKKMAERIHCLACNLAASLDSIEGVAVRNMDGVMFDTIRVDCAGGVEDVLGEAKARNIEFRDFGDGSLGISLNETTTHAEVALICECFGLDEIVTSPRSRIENSDVERDTPFLDHEVFNKYHTEHELLRYLYRLETKDIALTTSMITLGSCTMKLNSASSMMPLTLPGMGNIHPHTAEENVTGYLTMIQQCEDWLCEVTGFDAFSVQPNSGATGEYAGIRCITAYHEANDESHRTICLAPESAHGTNPASCTIAGLEVVEVACDPENGSIILDDLREKAAEYEDVLAAIMITYPSTYGIFDEDILSMIDIVHEHGGLVYMDGANMNAQVGYTSPGYMGADVAHLNLHKTFSIPHGGGGPGIGPIGVKEHLAEFLPNDVHWDQVGGENSYGQITSGPWGSAQALSIAWMYLRMLGGPGLVQSTNMAILNANYMAKCLEDDYPVLFRGKNGFVAHEFILDCRQFKDVGVTATDVAKRLMDYGFHAPTLGFPVPGTLMIEPTESESKEELDRFIDALKSIRHEIQEIEDGVYPHDDNVLVGAPHCASEVASDGWDHSYSRDKAAFPLDRLRYYKFWPQVGRVNDPYGDRNFCGTRFCRMEELDHY